uniref:Uncharacterized protein n=1 Tax=Oryza sativa subsp. japonica TaxID=39947 RepID=Q2R191_ORYSJ|nr:hypothetical protein LOC_Os11g39969 [Oryza sativa Japonica Group]
MAAIYIEKRL